MYVFFFNDTATTEIYTLSLHDALPICGGEEGGGPAQPAGGRAAAGRAAGEGEEADRVHPAARGRAEAVGRDRKSTRLNSSHANSSYAVFCLKKKQYLHSLLLLRDQVAM